MLSVLEKLDLLVIHKLLPTTPEISPNEFEDLLNIAQSEHKQIKNRLVEIFFQITDESRFEFFIHKIQNDITYLADRLFNSLHSEEIILSVPQKQPLTYKDLQISVYLILEDLLSSIERQFPKYFNIDATIPTRKRILAIHQFLGNIEDLNDLNNTIPPKLLLILTNPIKEFINNTSTSTYCRLNFLKRYLKEILSFKDIVETEEEFSFFIQRKLISINFNSIAFFNWATSEIINKINDQEDTISKLEKLSWYLKEINQIPVIPDLCYNPKLKSIKDLLSEWIVEEICHLENNLHRLTINSQVQQNQIDSNFKLITELSVPQYAFLLRTLVETGLYKNKNDDAKLTKLFALNTKTKGTLVISPKSLRQHFYKDDNKTREVVKTAIIKILNYIQTLD